MKKNLKIIIAVVIICAGVFFIGKFAFTNQLNLPDTDTAYLNFKYDDIDIHAKITEDEIDEIRNMVKGKDYSIDEGLACPFTDDISIEFEDIVFDDTVRVACDCGSILKIGKKLVYLKPNEKVRIHEIFEKYGGHFPAI